MNRLSQITLKRPARLEGPGLFTGEPAALTLRPAPPGSGIRFVRASDAGRSVIPADLDHLAEAPRHTVLRNGTLHVETVEHLMAAFAGLGVSNVEVELSGSKTGELPMADGSSRPFVEAVSEAGIEPQGDAPPVEPLVITRPVQVTDPATGASLVAVPGPGDHMEVVYTFEAPAPVGRQTCVFRFCPECPDGQSTADDFRNELAPARTFVFAHEVEALRSRGLGAHLNYKDLVVIGDKGPIENAFRFPDEPVRHKVLDLVGDLALVGRPIFGRVIAHKSGHALNHRLARALVAGESASEARALTHPHPQAAADAPPARGTAPTFGHLLGRPAVEAALDIRKIQRILPHRYPMLLVDRVLRIDGDQRAIGLKNVTMADVFLQGHYPGTPIYPGVLIIEAMAQLGGILLSRKLEHTAKLAVLLSLDKVKMRQPVVPGDQLILEAVAVRVKSRTGHVRCQAYIGDRPAAEADIKFMLVDAEAD